MVKDIVYVLLGFLVAAPIPYIINNMNNDDIILSKTTTSTTTILTASSSSDSNIITDTNNKRKMQQNIPTKHYNIPIDKYVCNNTVPFPDEYPKWDIIGTDQQQTKWDPIECFWANMWHPGVPMRPLPVCTHDPKQDGVISTFLHTYHFWGGPDDYNLLLAMGPCTKDRPYMLDIGANLGVYTILGASRGCRSISFEPLSQNILRLHQSLIKLGVEDNVLLFKHAVNKQFGNVKIGFRAYNPGVDADVTEHMGQLTIDGLLLGAQPPKFKNNPSKLPIIGKHINFIKIDTEGYDVAVVSGMLQTIIEGKPPHILIEFGPNDAQGTAGCNPYYFVQLMYAAGYRMYENAKAYPLRILLQDELPYALSGKGRRVFEAWFIHDDAAKQWVELGLLQVPVSSNTVKEK